MQEWLAKRNFKIIVRNTEKMQRYLTLFYDYFQGAKVDFTTLEIDIVGTEFQQLVWQQLRQIPYGEVWSYSMIAERISKPTAVRAVASAIGKNPLLVLIPCHRVIGKNGKLTGFRSGIPLKQQLLKLEGNFI